MAFLLGYGTAVEWLRQNNNVGLLYQRFDLPPLSIEGSRTRLQRHAEATKDLTRPLHLVVTSREDRRPSGETICHLFSPSAFIFHAVRVKQGMFCCGPELAFIQMANLLDEEQLLMLGMELCGRYGINKHGKLFGRMPTCTPDLLSSTAHKLGRVRGKRKALEVAPHVIPGAASPMEAVLALMLAEPPARHGFGIKPPDLNHALPVTGKARAYWDDDFITPDLLWEQEKLVVEYDSDAYHTASGRIARDALRRDVFVELGYRVVTVATKHMHSPRQIERIAQIVAEHIGQSLPSVSDDQWAERIDYQARMCRYAEHPSELLGFSKFEPAEKRTWSVRKQAPPQMR